MDLSTSLVLYICTKSVLINHHNNKIFTAFSLAQRAAVGIEKNKGLGSLMLVIQMIHRLH